MAAEEASAEPLKYRTWVLKVSIHCEGCKRKVKTVLHSIEGVYTTTIDSQKHKVTVVGDVDADTLIKKLIKRGKHAELWPEECENKSKKKGKGKKKKKKQKEQQQQQQKDTKSSDEDSSDDNDEDEQEEADDEGEEDDAENNVEHKQKSASNGENAKITVAVTDNAQPGNGPNGGSQAKKKKKKKKKKGQGQQGNNTTSTEGGVTFSDAPGGIGSTAPQPGPVNISPPRQIHHVYSHPSPYGGPQSHYLTPTYAVSYGYNVVHPNSTTSYAASYPQRTTYTYVEPETYLPPSDPLEVYSDEEEEEIGCWIM